MAEAISSTLHAIIQAGADEVAAEGTWPAAAAEQLLDKRWLSLGEEDRRSLAQTGLSVLINAEMGKRRRAEIEATEKVRAVQVQAPAAPPRPEPDPNSLTEEEVERLHDLFGGACTCVTHQPGHPNFSAKGRRGCVECFARGDTPTERTASAKAHFDEWKAGWDSLNEMLQKHFDFAAAKRAKEMLTSITLMGADGTMRSIMSFNAADLDKWKKESRAKEAGWRDRRKWFDLAAGKLAERGAPSLADLPAEDILELANAAEAVWKRGRKAKAVAL